MRHGSLFSGIGGFDLAAEWMGWENVFHCEWNEFGQKILKHYWPDAISYGDITKTDFSIHRGSIDILTGGFPCQPYSTAGKRLGKEDDRHLWPEMLRAIREIQPGWIVGENVRGLTNWKGGMVFDEVQADLEAEGYEVLPFLLPACAVNAPHRRDRIWFVAHSEGSGVQREKGNVCEKNGRQGTGQLPKSKQPGSGYGNEGVATNPTIVRSHWNDCNGKEGIKRRTGWQTFNLANGNGGEGFASGIRWNRFPTQPPVCGRNDGIPDRVDRIKALGNAVVPQVVYEIFKAIELYETEI